MPEHLAAVSGSDSPLTDGGREAYGANKPQPANDLAESSLDGEGGSSVVISRVELARLRGIEDAARWHLNNSACRGWQQGAVLMLALGLNPDSVNEQWARLLDALGIEHDEHDPLSALLAGEAPDA